MPLIDIPIDVITENIKETKRCNDLQEIKDNNKRLRREKSDLFQDVTSTKVDLGKYEERLGMVTRNLKSGNISVETVKVEKPTFTQAIKGHVSMMTEFRKTLDTSNLAVEAIPAQLKTIEEHEELMQDHIQGVIGNMADDIKNSKTISNIPTNGWVHCKGDYFCSGEAHAERIVNACVTHNTPMTRLNLAIILGVKVDSHGVKAALASLNKEKVLITSQDKGNQEIFSLTPATTFPLDHKILPTNKKYIDKITTGNTCINVWTAAKAA